MGKLWGAILKIGGVIKTGASLFSPANILSIISLIKDLKNLWLKVDDYLKDRKIKNYHEEKAELQAKLNKASEEGNENDIELYHTQLVELERLWKQRSDNSNKDN